MHYELCINFAFPRFQRENNFQLSIFNYLAIFAPNHFRALNDLNDPINSRNSIKDAPTWGATDVFATSG